MTERDLQVISRNFIDCEIPREKMFLLKYFDTEIQKAFLRYYLIFGDLRNFSDHTGYRCSERLLYRFQFRLKRLLEIYEHAKKSLSEDGMNTVLLIETGNFPLTRQSLNRRQA